MEVDSEGVENNVDVNDEYNVSNGLGDTSIVASKSPDDGEDTELDATTTVAAAERLEAIMVDDSGKFEDTAVDPFSKTRFASPLKSGRNRVHQNATRRLRSMIRCLVMKRTTKMKNMNADIINIRSSQSDFSSAVMRCFDVPMRLARVSCVDDVERRDAVDASGIYYSLMLVIGKALNSPSICVDKTDRSSSPCIIFMVRRRASVTSSFAFIRTSSL